MEIDCRVVPELSGKCELDAVRSQWRLASGHAGEGFYIARELNSKEVETSLTRIKNMGINSIAVALAHSYTFHDHELQIGELAKKLGSLPYIIFFTNPFYESNNQ